MALVLGPEDTALFSIRADFGYRSGTESFVSSPSWYAAERMEKDVLHLEVSSVFIGVPGDPEVPLFTHRRPDSRGRTVKRPLLVC